MNSKTVSIQVPPVASYLSLLRTVVGGCAGREGFTIDQISDVKMAVDEAAGQLLKHVADGSGAADAPISLEVTSDEGGIDLRIGAATGIDGDVIDPKSFSWTILQALSDVLEVENDGRLVTVAMRKLRADQDDA